MTDTIELAQEREQLDRQLALDAHQRGTQPGLPECEECGAPISELRQGLGARLCVAHATAHEAEIKKRGARACL